MSVFPLSAMIRDFRLRHRFISSLQDLDVRGFRRLASRLPYWLIPAPGGPVTLRTLYGFCLHIDPVRDSGIEHTLYYTGTYEKGTLHILKKHLRPGDIFVDVGANIGLMSIYASRLVGNTGSVFAFEPNPETLGLLRMNIELNRAGNISVSGLAIGEKAGEAMIYERWDSNRGSASLIDPGIETTTHRVAVTTLDEFFLSDPGDRTGRPGDRIKLIKMDIEGYELEALRGASGILSGPDPPALIIECTDDHHSGRIEAIFEFLSDCDHYRIFKLKGGKSRTSHLREIHRADEMPLKDNVFCCTREHITR